MVANDSFSEESAAVPPPSAKAGNLKSVGVDEDDQHDDPEGDDGEEDEDYEVTVLRDRRHTVVKPETLLVLSTHETLSPSPWFSYFSRFYTCHFWPTPSLLLFVELYQYHRSLQYPTVPKVHILTSVQSTAQFVQSVIASVDYCITNNTCIGTHRYFVSFLLLDENLNAPKPSEHLPYQGWEFVKTSTRY